MGENKVIRFTVPGNPMRWQRPGQDRHGRRFSVKEVEDAKAMVAWELKRVFSGPVWLGPVRISALFIFAIPPSWPAYLRTAAQEGRVDHIMDPDLDQLIKLVMDALPGIIVADDNQISRFGRSAKRYGTVARSEIVIELLDQPRDCLTPGGRRLLRAWENGPPEPKTRLFRRNDKSSGRNSGA